MYQRAFTLIELSIVLVIIGLIVGGVLVGKDMIKASEMRGVAADFEKFTTASNTFKLKYNCIPGDCSRATQFFTTTANGNGNTVFEIPASNNETWLFWQHLALAGFINGTYSGDNGPDGPFVYADAIIGTNVPGTARKGAGFSIAQGGIQGQSSAKQNAMIVGGDSSSNNGNIQTYGTMFPIVELAGFDAKFDDGQANDGMIRAAQYWSFGCDVTGANPTYSYNNSTTSVCAILMLF